MNRKQMKANVGKVVAYVDHITGAVLPARVLDARMWEMRYGPEPCVRLTAEYRANRGNGGIKVGYPMLMPVSGVRRSAAEQKQLEKFLAETTLTMDDLFDENGESTGILDGDRKGILNERLIFRVVFPKDAREPYEGVVREERAKRAALMAELDEARYAAEVVRKAAVRLSNTLAEYGFKSPDHLPVVAQNVTNAQRVSLDVNVLDELVRVALPYLTGCATCGVHDFLLPVDVLGVGMRMLCAECHPRCRE